MKISCIVLICGTVSGVEGLISITTQLKQQKTYFSLEILPYVCCTPYLPQIEAITGIPVTEVPHNGTYDKCNLGIQAATGDYIGFFPGDDIYDPTYIGKLLVAAMIENADIVYCDFYSHYRQDGTPSPGGLEMGHITTGSFLVKAEKAKKHTVPITQTGDIEFVQEIMKEDGFKSAYVPEALYIHR
jgi:hypothetical protein